MKTALLLCLLAIPACDMLRSDDAEPSREKDFGQWKLSISTVQCTNGTYLCDYDTCCRSTCADDEYTCQDTGRCLPIALKCDGIQDCDNGYDERFCGTTEESCPGGWFHCMGGACILRDWVCDGVTDCVRGDDEQRCD